LLILKTTSHEPNGELSSYIFDTTQSVPLTTIHSPRLISGGFETLRNLIALSYAYYLILRANLIPKPIRAKPAIRIAITLEYFHLERYFATEFPNRTNNI
jgi:hypothetical protein